MKVCFPGFPRKNPGSRADLKKLFDLANNRPPAVPSFAAPDYLDSSVSDPSTNVPPTVSPEQIVAVQDHSPHQTRLESDTSYREVAGVVRSVASPSFHRRRRRRTATITPPTGAEIEAPLSNNPSGSEPASQDSRTNQSHSLPTDRSSPSPKRRRTSTMRPDGVSSANGFGQASNGSGSSPSRKSALSPSSLNGQSTYQPLNGDTSANGYPKQSANLPSYYGHDREEITRILIQSLYELGYNGAASLLGKESGYQLESPAVATFRSAVLEGRWTEAEQILVQSFYPDDGGKSTNREKLLLADDADKCEMLFYLRQQKFLELLESRDLGAALLVLRHELTPLNYDIGRLHALSRYVLSYTKIYHNNDLVADRNSLLMCPPEHLHDQAGWNRPISSSRERLLSELSSKSPRRYCAPNALLIVSIESISPSVMIPGNRLAILLDHVKQNQINQCLYHNTASPPSLYSDHMCDRADFPLQSTIELCQHTDEVWYCEFSHDGTKLVTAGRDRSVIIYDTSTFDVIHKLSDHEEGVAQAVWSPDDTRLITCSQDKKARVWCVEVRTPKSLFRFLTPYPS